MKGSDERLGYMLYQKPTHTDWHLHRESTHHPGQTHAAIEPPGSVNKSTCKRNSDTWIMPSDQSVVGDRDKKNDATNKISKVDQDGRADFGGERPILPYVNGVIDRIGGCFFLGQRVAYKTFEISEGCQGSFGIMGSM